MLKCKKKKKKKSCDGKAEFSAFFIQALVSSIIIIICLGFFDWYEVQNSCIY